MATGAKKVATGLEKGQKVATERRIMVNQYFAVSVKYKGIKFRSRQEARWAVFFDTLGIQWLYEPEAYKLERTVYLPDFWLPRQDCFWEVKAPGGGGEGKADGLVKLTKKPVYIHYGEVALSELFTVLGESLYDQSDNAHALWWKEGVAWDNYYLWCECPKCGLLGLEFEGRAARLPCGCCPDSEVVDWINAYSPRILEAYHAAQRYRFW